MVIVNVRFEEGLVRKLDELVRRGIFKTRSDALRIITQEYLEGHPELFLWREAEKWTGVDIEDSKLEELCARLFSRKRTAAKIVAEGRVRN